MPVIGDDRILHYCGQDLYDRDGETIGSIEAIYLDRETSAPEWALVKTGLFALQRAFVPLHGATESEDRLTVPFEKRAVKAAPDIKPIGWLSVSEVAELYRHYGLEYSNQHSASGLPQRGRGDAARRIRGRRRADRDRTDTPGLLAGSSRSD